MFYIITPISLIISPPTTPYDLLLDIILLPPQISYFPIIYYITLITYPLLGGRKGSPPPYYAAFQGTPSMGVGILPS